MPIWSWIKGKIYDYRIEDHRGKGSTAGNRTLVARLTGGNTHHYTTNEMLGFKYLSLYFCSLWVVCVTVCSMEGLCFLVMARIGTPKFQNTENAVAFKYCTRISQIHNHNNSAGPISRLRQTRFFILDISDISLGGSPFTPGRSEPHLGVHSGSEWTKSGGSLTRIRVHH